VPVLADERDRAVIAVRYYRGPARMAHDLAHVSLLALAHRVAHDADQFARVNLLARQDFGLLFV